ncbi:MAG: citrate/2-methylcitrate synthase [Phototrophicaceae bacterium]
MSQGLDGVIVGDSTTSLVNGVEGKLIYSGYRIEDLAMNALFEEVAFLLWNNRLPNQAELDELVQQIAKEAVLPEGVITLMKALPTDAHPMAVLRTAVSALAHFDADSESNHITDKDKSVAHRIAVRLTGQITTATAAWERIRNGQEPVAPRADLNLSQNFVYMLTGTEPDETASKAINVYLVLLAEHGMNASTFTSRVVTGTIADMHSAITAAIGALKGFAHGGANSEAMYQFLEIGEPDNVENWFNSYIKTHEKRVMGIGHRIYKALDPRASILKEHARALSESSGNTKWFEIAERLEQAALADEYFIERKLYPNVDYYSAIVLYTLNIPVDSFTPLFAMARIAGWTAHVIEQMGGRLIRPEVNYVGAMDLDWLPMDAR